MKKNRACVLFLGMMIGASLYGMTAPIKAQASGVGVAAMLGYTGNEAPAMEQLEEAAELAETISVNAEAAGSHREFVEGDSSDLVMANVNKAMNVRTDPSEDGAKAGILYKDCGGRILEQKNGWTKIESGNLVGWAKDDYLLFGEDAQELAAEVGSTIITVDCDALYLRDDDSVHADSMAVLTRGDSLDVIEEQDNGWTSVEYDDEVGYVQSDYVSVTFRIDSGETMAEIHKREEEERQAELKRNRGRVDANADEVRLLAALIVCEAGNQPYEGKVSVGAVVMNRVKSGGYPNTIHSVIYASGQFTPALNGKVASVYNGNISDSCLQAAQAAINGETYVGGATHFKRAGRHDGQVIGGHVFW
ncbi:cell wall hydrolase [Butyrivibrio sp. MC2013]|uniref:cell wall hydrolase n=1 Tax=Butyrivibrio sp. MC2013 TaxID=1280686 RepID=UPI000403D8F8|nr:cell wall hydrolase [Butyrivibrio sp. MC2013]